VEPILPPVCAAATDDMLIRFRDVQGWLEEARQLTLYHCVPTRSARVVWLLEVMYRQRP
jgi:hypothetical protein